MAVLGVGFKTATPSKLGVPHLAAGEDERPSSGPSIILAFAFF